MADASKGKIKPKVLVVDDEHMIADTLAIILNQSGYDAMQFIPAQRQWRAPAPTNRTSSSATSLCPT